MPLAPSCPNPCARKPWARLLAVLLLAGMATVTGFALIWQVWWLAIASLVALLGTAIFHTFNYDRTFYIKADHIAEVEAARTAQLAAAYEKGAA